jgi:hypothetical protein
LRELQRNGHEPRSLPLGLSYPILNRVDSYFKEMEGEHRGWKMELINAGPDAEIVFDGQLWAAVQEHLALLDKSPSTKLYGYSVQGVLYEVCDQEYVDPTADVLVEIDPGDGTRWVCSIPRNLLPEKIADYWQKRVFVEGNAEFRVKKPKLEATSFKVLLDFDTAFERFLKSGQEVWGDADSTDYMDDFREREQ